MRSTGQHPAGRATAPAGPRPAPARRSEQPLRGRLASALTVLGTALSALVLVLGASPTAPASAASTSSMTTTSATAAIGAVTPAVSRAADKVVDGKVTVTIDALDHEVLRGDEDLTVTGTIANGTDAAVSSLSLRVDVQNRTALSSAELAAWLDEDQTGGLTTVLTQDLDEAVEAGASRAFSLKVPHDSLPLFSSDQWGPRGVQVTALASGTELAGDRTIVVWDDDVAVSPTRVTTVVPVTASPAELALLTSPGGEAAVAASVSASAEPTEEATASATQAGTAEEDSTAEQVAAVRERVLGLLSLAGDGVVLAVDPALMEALGVPSDAAASAGATASPTASSTASAQATGSASATPTASAAPTATASEQASTEPTVAPTEPTGAAADSSTEASATTDTELVDALKGAAAEGDVVALPWSDADVAALAHLGRGDLITSATSRSAVSGTVEDGASTGVAWVADTLDTSTLSALGGTTTTVIASPGDLPVAEDLTYTPSGTTVVDGRTVLVPDTDLSSALGGRLTTDAGETNLSDLDARQVLRADAAILTRQAPSVSRDVVVTLSRTQAARTDPEVLRTRIAALSDSGWTGAQGLDDLLADADQSSREGRDAARQDLPSEQRAASEVSAADLTRATQAASYLSSVASVLEDPSAVLGRQGDVVATTASASWRTDTAGRDSNIAAAREAGDAVAAGLTAVPSSTINLISSNADLPVRITSSLDQDVTVRVHLVPSTQRLQADADTTVTVPARGEVTSKVPVTAVGSGDVELTIEVLAADGTRVGTPTTVHMRVRADWENLGTRVIGVGLVIMLAAGITRTVRRGRRTVTPQEKA
ncbi:hypothetical protein AXF14_04785 [Actinomyces radicidentis]|uniref:Uncharacterized protein n=1 Tax=Actinomyces radicidentis TaxID=111015 RepID=A0A0X8JEE7_ACTRD|nr:DUF6049 family protein [Actinomyces radicidentis]AMD87032.1 hypothetical protein AXF14_04785 [Actinomyces radicidentis]